MLIPFALRPKFNCILSLGFDRNPQTKENLASELSREWEIPFSRARADVESIVEQWRLRGLLAGSERRATAVAAEAVDWRRAPSPRWTAEWICTIRGVAIAFGCEN